MRAGRVVGSPASEAAREPVQLRWARFSQDCRVRTMRLREGFPRAAGRPAALWPAASSPHRGQNGRAFRGFGFKIAEFCRPLAACVRVLQLSYFVSRSLFRQTIPKYGFQGVKILSAVGL